MRFRHNFFISVFAAVLLEGCASTGRANNPGHAYTPSPSKAEMDLCDRLLLDNAITKKNAVSYEECVIGVKNKYSLYRDDLDKLDDYKRLELAKLWANGKIDATQFNIKATENEVQINNARLARRNQYQSVDTARRLAEAAEVNAAANAASASRSIVSCSKYSNTVDCYSY